MWTGLVGVPNQLYSAIIIASVSSEVPNDERSRETT